MAKNTKYMQLLKEFDTTTQQNAILKNQAIVLNQEVAQAYNYMLATPISKTIKNQYKQSLKRYNNLSNKIKENEKRLYVLQNKIAYERQKIEHIA